MWRHDSNKIDKGFKRILHEQRFGKKQKKSRLFKVSELEEKTTENADQVTAYEPAYVPEDVMNIVRVQGGKAKTKMTRSRSEKIVNSVASQK